MLAPLNGTGSVSTDSEIRIKFHQTLQTNVYGTVSFLSETNCVLDLLNSSISFETTVLTNDTAVIKPVTGLEPLKEYRGIKISGFQAVRGRKMETVVLSNYYFVTDLLVRTSSLPSPPVLHPLQRSNNHVTLTWDAIDTDIRAYAVFRSSGRPWHRRIRIGVVRGTGELQFIDRIRIPETYYYTVHAINNNGDWSGQALPAVAALYPSGVVLRLDRCPALTELYPFPRNSYYRAPRYFLKIKAGASHIGVPLDTRLSEGFRIKEFVWNNDVQSWDRSEKDIKTFGYAVLDPAAIAGLERIRKRYGRIRISSGFRSPERNGAIGGATHSRHMFGDAFDILIPSAAAWTNLRNIAESEGADFIEPYTMTRTWLHCDWRYGN